MLKTVQVDKIASVVHRLNLGSELPVTTHLEARTGNPIVVRVLGQRSVSGELELTNGHLVRILDGDVVVGALGCRRALRGFDGEVPQRVGVGDVLAILNRGGVVGARAREHQQLGSPLACEVIGMPLIHARIPNLQDARVGPAPDRPGLKMPPLLVVSGTSMESGKTRLVTELVRQLSGTGFRVAGAKLTGVACLRDLIAMKGHGAIGTASFLDAGYPSTAGLDHAARADIARTLVTHLASYSPDLIVVELGDGVIGDYGVLDLLKDPVIRRAMRLHLFCASDLAGAWGGHRYLSDNGIHIDLFSGPVTDSLVGVEYLEAQFNRPAVNACRYPARLAEVVRSLLHTNARRVS